MCPVTAREYVSCSCTGSKPVSATAKATRKVLAAPASARTRRASAAAGVSRNSRRCIRGSSGFRASRVVDVDVLEEVACKRMAPIAEQPWMRDIVDIAVPVNLVRHVDDEQPLHLTDDRVAFRTIGNLSLLVVEPVVLGLNEACVVGAADVLAGAECEEGIRIRPGGRPAERPHHQLPDARRLRVLRPLVDLELDADAERLQLTLPPLVECAIELTRMGRKFEHEGRRVG